MDPSISLAESPFCIQHAKSKSKGPTAEEKPKPTTLPTRLRCKHPACIPLQSHTGLLGMRKAFDKREEEKKKKRERGLILFRGKFFFPVSKLLQRKVSSFFSLYFPSPIYFSLKGEKNLLPATALRSGSQGSFQMSPAKVLNASVHWRLAAWQTLCLFSRKL